MSIMKEFKGRLHLGLSLCWLWIISICFNASPISALPRANHTAVLLNDILYIMGGNTNVENGNSNGTLTAVRDQHFLASISLGAPFVTKQPRLVYNALKGDNLTRIHALAMADAEDREILLYGGFDGSYKVNDKVQEIDLNSMSWSDAGSSGFSSAGLVGVASAQKDQMSYVYGGGEFGTNRNGSTGYRVKSDFIVYDVEKRKSTKLPDINGENTGRFYATLTYVERSDSLYMLGGLDNRGQLRDMQDIYVYSLAEKKWSLKKASGDGSVPAARAKHTAVAVGKNIIVYGGEGRNRTIDGDVYVLDTESMTWSKPLVKNAPRGHIYHTATKAAQYIIYAFGMLSGREYDSNIHILDTDSWEFVSYFPGLASAKGLAIVKGNDPSGLSSMTIAAIIGGSLIGCVLVVFGTIALVRHRAARRREANMRKKITFLSQPGTANPLMFNEPHIKLADSIGIVYGADAQKPGLDTMSGLYESSYAQSQRHTSYDPSYNISSAAISPVTANVVDLSSHTSLPTVLAGQSSSTSPNQQIIRETSVPEDDEIVELLGVAVTPQGTSIQEPEIIAVTRISSSSSSPASSRSASPQVPPQQTSSVEHENTEPDAYPLSLPDLSTVIDPSQITYAAITVNDEKHNTETAHSQPSPHSS
jgi:hypothetical protein